MVAPLIYVGGVAVTMAANIGLEYAIARYQGKQLSQQDYVESAALGIVPGLGLTKHSYKFGRIGKAAYESRRGVPKSAWEDIAAMSLTYGQRPARALTKVAVKSAVYRYAIHAAYKPSRAVVRSLTSSTKRPGTTTRVPGAKRSYGSTYIPGVKNQGSRRRTTYCKKHLRYDFCKYYNK